MPAYILFIFALLHAGSLLFAGQEPAQKVFMPRGCPDRNAPHVNNLLEQLDRSPEPRLRFGHKNFRFDARDWESIWQPLCNNALAHLITGDEKHLRRARMHINALCSYPHWGNPDQPGVNLGLEASLPLLQLSLAFDWIGDKLTKEERSMVMAKLKHQGDILLAALNKHGSNDPRFAMALTSTYIASLLNGMDDEGYAMQNTPVVHDHMKTIRQTLLRFNDGSLPMDMRDGIQYSQALLLFLAAEKQFTGKVDFLESPWMKLHATWLAAQILPGSTGIWSTRRETSGMRQDPSHLLYMLASFFSDAHSAWCADQWLAQSQNPSALQTWLFLSVLFDPVQLSRKAPAGFSTAHFKANGLVCARNGWEMGSDFLVMQDSHSPFPQRGSFDWLVDGRWVFFGFKYPNSLESEHSSTLLVDGAGQQTANNWTQAVYATKTLNDVQNNSQITRAELSAHYKADSSLQKFDRTVAWIDGNILLIIDHVVCEKPKKLDLLFQSANYDLQTTANGYTQSVTGMELSAQSFPPASWSFKKRPTGGCTAMASITTQEWHHVAVIAPRGYARDLQIKAMGKDLSIQFAAYEYEMAWKENSGKEGLVLYKNSRKQWSFGEKP